MPRPPVKILGQLVMEEPPAKRHHQCSNPSDREEDWSVPMRCSTPVRQLEGEGELSGSLDELDEEVEHEGDRDDVLSIASGLDYFGLNEESIESFICEVESEEPSLNWLPWEVLEVVFCQLPLVELFTGCRLVCKRWNDIIMREKFLLWKKRYHMAKSGRCPPATVTMNHFLHQYKMVDDSAPPPRYFSRAGALIRAHQSPCLLNMARFVGKEFENVEFGEGVMKVLRAHPQYPCVERIVELHPQLREGGETLGTIQTLSLLVVCCCSVHQAFSLLLSLLTPGMRDGGDEGFGTPMCRRIPVTEVFYCLACLCYALWEKGVLPQRFHYFIFYSLNVLERGPFSGPLSPLSCSQQQEEQPHISKYDLQLTSEQCKIINHPLRPGETVQVKAFAGTGKTTTLCRFTALNPNWRFLYCVYNKSVQVHAEESVFLQGNVQCRTFHSLAYRDVGKYYHSKRLSNLKPYKVSQWVKDVPFMRSKQDRFIFSKYVYVTLLKFFASESRELTEQHLARMDPLDADCADLGKVTGYYAAAVVREARRIWGEMINKNNKNIGMTEDGYLKLYQLQNPQITGYDCILVDEAQDLTPAIISIVKAQSCAKVLVGDPHQQIYGFKGATNAMSLIPADHTFHLTRSFRFGPEIAYTASCILEVLNGVRRQTIVGGLQAGGIQGEQSGQLAVIARCNDTLFLEMVRVVESGNKLRLGFTGGNDKDKHKYADKKKDKDEFDLLLDIHMLLQGKTPKDPHQLVKRFIGRKAPFKDLKAEVERDSDVALLKKIKICERFYRDLPTIIGKIRSMTCSDISFADIVFSTAHKSKGLEFDTVKLTDDYLESHDFNDPYSYLPPDERNLLYVAATRAKRQLIITPTLLDVLHRAGEFFVHPSGSQETQQTGVVCAVCSLTLPPPRLLLERTQIQLSNTPQTHKGGFVCKMCSYTVLPCFGACL